MEKLIKTLSLSNAWSWFWKFGNTEQDNCAKTSVCVLGAKTLVKSSSAGAVGGETDLWVYKWKSAGTGGGFHRGFTAAVVLCCLLSLIVKPPFYQMVRNQSIKS